MGDSDKIGTFVKLLKRNGIMVDKILVEICVGTYAWVMGGSKLADLEEYIPAEWRSYVEVKGVISLPGCDEEGSLKPPFVAVDGKIIESATIPLVLDEIKKALQNKGIK